MALALLCSRLETGLLQDESELQNGDSQTWDSIIPHLRFRAFVVDHGVRSGSHDEASAVAEILEKRGKFQLTHKKKLTHMFVRHTNRCFENEMARVAELRYSFKL